MFLKLFRRKAIISGFFVLVFSFTASPVSAEFNLSSTFAKLSISDTFTKLSVSNWFTTYQTKVNQIENKVVKTFTTYYDSYTTELANILYKPKAITAAVITTKETTPPPAPLLNQGGERGGNSSPIVVAIAPSKTITQGPMGPQGPAGPRGPAGSSTSGDFVSTTTFDNQVEGILTSIENNFSGLSKNLSTEVNTTTLNVTGNSTLTGALSITGDITKIKNITYAWPSSHTTSGVLQNDGSGALTWSTLGAAAVTADSLNFSEFTDALTLDASTDIAVDNAEVFSVTNTGTGNSLVINDEASDATPFTIDNAGNVSIGGTLTVPTPFTLGATSVTSTGTQLNYLSSATGTTGTTSTNLVFSTSPTLVTPVLGAATYTTLSGGNITDSGLTATRVTFAGTAGILSDDADLSFATDTLSATKLLSGTSVSTPSLISTGAVGITPAAGSNLNVTLSTTGDFAVNTNQLYVDTSTGFVGIGTTTPASALTVTGNVQLGGSSTFSLDSANNLALSNGTNAQTFTVYNTRSGANAEYVQLGADGTNVYVLSGISGSGTQRNLLIGTNGASNVGNLLFYAGGTGVFAIDGGDQSTNALIARSDGQYAWSPNTTINNAAVDTGLSRISAGVIGIGTGAQGSTAGTLLANTIGIGTTSPQSLLDIQGPTGTGTATAGILTLATKELTIVDGDELGRINFNSPLESDGSDSILAGAAIWAEADDTFSATVNSTELVFATATTSAAVERMRIDSSGNVGIGDSTPDYLLDVAGTAGFDGLLTMTGSAANIALGSNYLSGDGGDEGLTVASDGNVTVSNYLDAQNIRTAGGYFYASQGNWVKLEGTMTFGWVANGNISGGAFTTTLSQSSAGVLALRDVNGAVTSGTLLTGTIGLGTTSPQSLLDIQGPTGTGTATAGILTLATKELTIVDGDELGRINFNSPLESDGTDAILAGAAIWAEADDTFSATVNSSELVFATATTSAAVERMRIDSSGNVGIGTTGPSQLLHVKSSGEGLIFAESTGGTGNNVGVLIKGGGTNANWLVGTNRADLAANVDDLIFYKNAGTTGTKMVLQNSGNVGIGTTSPQSLLDIQGPTGTGTATAGILTLATKELTIVDGDELGRINFNAPLESDGSDAILAGAAIWAEADDTFSATVNSSELVFATATTSAAVERMRIDSSGNVGIGTTGPADILHLTTGNLRIGASTATRATTAGTNQLILFDGTAPVGTLTNGISLYSTAGELRVMDAAGNATLLSPHENINNYWIFDSANGETGKTLVVDMELMMKQLNATFGWDFVHEKINGVETAPSGIPPLGLRLEGIEERLALLEGGSGIVSGDGTGGIFSSITAKFKDIYGVIWENGIMKIAQVISDKITTKELCVEDVCINKDQLKELLDKNNINGSADTATEEENNSDNGGGGGGVADEDGEEEEDVADENLEGEAQEENNNEEKPEEPAEETVDEEQESEGPAEETEIPEEVSESKTEENPTPEN